MIDLSSRAERHDTGSVAFNNLLGGGLHTCSMTDVYGAAATGKTQFAFQNALMTSVMYSKEARSDKPAVVFVDCAGSFRPERIQEIGEARGLSGPTHDILDRISSIYVRSVAEQHEASERILSSEKFDMCRLLIVDDVTTNFVSEYPGTAPEENDEADGSFIARHYELSRYARKLAYIAISKRIAVLLTNSVRTRIVDGPVQETTASQNSATGSPPRAVEGESTGDIISQFAFIRMHFTREGGRRLATIVQPYVLKNKTEFRIEKQGIVP